MHKMMITSAFFKAFFTALFSAFVYYFYFIEIVREKFEDAAFDGINLSLMSNVVSSTSSSVMLFKMDDLYLHKNKLLDDNNETNYGYVFPRRYITKFITDLDTFTNQNTENCPKLLFIDYNMAYSSRLDGLSLSEEDENLIKVLKTKRCYKIILPKTQSRNMVQEYEDDSLHDAITNEYVSFASVNLATAGDNITRRYHPYQKYIGASGKENIYLNVSLMIWLLSKENNITEVYKNFHIKKESLLENRIIYKRSYETVLNNSYRIEQSLWKQLKMYSAHYSFDNIIEEQFKDSILLLGASYSASNDKFIIDILDRQLSGIEVHANALMTLFYLEGSLKQLNIFITLSFIFMSVFLLDVFISLVSNKYALIKEHHTSFLIVLSVMMMFGFSAMLLICFKVWFNWLTPSILATLATLSPLLSKQIPKKLFMLKSN